MPATSLSAKTLMPPRSKSLPRLPSCLVIGGMLVVLLLPPWGVALHGWPRGPLPTHPRGQELAVASSVLPTRPCRPGQQVFTEDLLCVRHRHSETGTCAPPGLLSYTPDLSGQHLRHISIWVASGRLHLNRSQSELPKSPHPAPLLHPSHLRQGHLRFPIPLLGWKTLGLSLTSLSLFPLPHSIHQQILVAQLSKSISILSPPPTSTANFSTQ